jgi:methyltransferase family protein
MTTTAAVRPETIERLAMAVYPSFAMLAGMELDVFTTLKDGPLTGLQVAATLGVDPIRLNPLLYALVTAGLLTIAGERFDNTSEASQFLVSRTSRLRRHEASRIPATLADGPPNCRIDSRTMPRFFEEW